MGKKERKGKGRRTNIEKCKTGIAYQNKDIVSKIFAESLIEKSLNVYGLNVPKVVGVLPTNLPTVEANELRMISQKIQKRLEISETDMMKMIILPLAYPGKKTKNCYK